MVQVSLAILHMDLPKQWMYPSVTAAQHDFLIKHMTLMPFLVLPVYSWHNVIDFFHVVHSLHDMDPQTNQALSLIEGCFQRLYPIIFLYWDQDLHIRLYFS